jgi:hypothetical protein
MQQHVTHCNTLQLHYTAPRCNTLQHNMQNTATCSTLQHAAHCNILQHTATHFGYRSVFPAVRITVIPYVRFQRRGKKGISCRVSGFAYLVTHLTFISYAECQNSSSMFSNRKIQHLQSRGLVQGYDCWRRVSGSGFRV